MYEEGHSNFVFRSIILKILFIIVLVFLILWLFPTKNYVKNLIDQKLGTSVNQVFNTNINTMKDAALSYFNGSRLPSNDGDSITITLKEMVDKNLLVDFTDSNGKKCDYDNSYAKATKNKSDYTIKVNLVCKDKSSYINSYIDQASMVDSKKKITSDSNQESKDNLTSSKTNNENKDNSSALNTEKDNTAKESKNITQSKECQYVKKINGYYTNYGSWSGWTGSKIGASNLRQVETKEEKIQTGTVVEQEGTYKHTQNPKKVTVTNNGKKSILFICPSDFDNGGSYNSFVTCVKTMPNYVNKPIYRTVTYYRYRDRKYISGSNSYKWSTCNNSALTSQGYQFTGQTR